MCQVTIIGGELFQEEINTYIGHYKEKYHAEPVSLKINVIGVEVELEYHMPLVPFQGLRRITGYLVGTLDRWNDGKHTEERDRVKHNV